MRRRIQTVLRRIVIGLALVAMTLGILGCNSSGTQSSEPIKATWIIAEVVKDTVSIPVTDVQNSRMAHFMLGTPTGDIAFMAYELGSEIYVRSNLCPPCRSIGFSLQKDILVCDTCKTTFKAKTGDGINGACVDFPKASVKYAVTDGIVVMTAQDLLSAYQNTLKPGLP